MLKFLLLMLDILQSNIIVYRLNFIFYSLGALQKKGM